MAVTCCDSLSRAVHAPPMPTLSWPPAHPRAGRTLGSRFQMAVQQRVRAHWLWCWHRVVSDARRKALLCNDT